MNNRATLVHGRIRHALHVEKSPDQSSAASMVGLSAGFAEKTECTHVRHGSYAELGQLQVFSTPGTMAVGRRCKRRRKAIGCPWIPAFSGGDADHGYGGVHVERRKWNKVDP